MQTDLRGLALSGADAATAASLRQFQLDFQAFRDEAAAIIGIAEAAPGCPVAQLYAAAMHVYSQSELDIAAAVPPLLARARAATSDATERERLLTAAVSAWAAADFATAASAFEAIAAEWPQDVIAAKFAEFVFFQAPDFPRHLRFMQSVAAANADLPNFGGMLAFAHELNREFDAAERIAEAALAAEPDTPWAHHALGHLYLNTARIDDGLRSLEAFAPLWAGHGQGIRCHNYWHVALLRLGRMDVSGALALYRDWIAGRDPASAFEHTDAISLLWRLELSGQTVPPEDWAPMLPYARARAGDRVMPFMNAHYVHALGRAGEGAAARDALARLAARTVTEGEPWRTGLGLLRGVLALAEGDAKAGVAAMEPIFDTVGCTGGSDAQNDLFAQAYLVGLVRAGRRSEAHALLKRRTAGRAPTPQEGSWLQAA
jgi:tetratricopeptide (TPR) repeat protein